MQKLLSAVMIAAVTMTLSSLAEAQMTCPREVTQAKRVLNTKISAARARDAQAPRGQDVQAPRGQDVQAPRGQDVQAPRGEDVQSPYALARDNMSRASLLVHEAEAACEARDHKTAREKATEAIAILR